MHKQLNVVLYRVDTYSQKNKTQNQKVFQETPSMLTGIMIDKR